MAKDRDRRSKGDERRGGGGLPAPALAAEATRASAAFVRNGGGDPGDAASMIPAS